MTEDCPALFPRGFEGTWMRKALKIWGKILGVVPALFCGLWGGGVIAQEALPLLEEQVIAENTSLKALKLVQNYMRDVKSLRANFVQRAPGNILSRGTLSMQRPGKIRFDFKDDIPFLVVADGKTINFVDYEIGQVQKWPVKDTPLLAVIGEGFDLASVNAQITLAPEGMEGILSLVASDPARPEMGKITVYFEQTPDQAHPLRLLSWVVLDAQGQTTVVEIFDQEINPSLAAKLWTFDDPRGLAKRRRTRR
jgi:outer membrane lipoprotein-sorting protein